ncbi:MAG: hypothetical protein JO011_11630 [Ktedonobacteraceae bacterium]|nr:hypothetical protein [Ktedonobacteraceae bacterium]
MKNLSTFSANSPQGDPYPPPQRERNQSPRGAARLLQGWYRISSPSEPDESAPFEERELFRRGRTGSQITIFLFILLLISYPAAFAGSNSFLITIVTIDLFILTFAMVLNRLRMVSIAGILVVICFIASPTVNILTTPGGVNTSSLPVFGLLVLPLMCAVSFLPPWWVFVVGAGNCLFTVYVLKFMPSAGELHRVLAVAFPGIVTPILLSQGIVSIVAFLWVRGARQALLRADRAEEIARLEAIQIKHQEEQLAISRQLEEGIQQIITTMSTVVTNNDFSIRVPLSQENILWRVSKSINNLLSRLQGLKQGQEELKRTHAVAAEIAHRMREGQPIQLGSWTGTAFDPVIIEYNKRFRNPSGQSTREPFDRG